MSKAKELTKSLRVDEANEKDEQRKLKSYKDTLAALEEFGVSSKPAYTGWGIEIYQDMEKQIQVVANMRSGTLLIHRGY